MFERLDDWREHAGPLGVEPLTPKEADEKRQAEERAARAYPYGLREKKKEPVGDPSKIDQETRKILNALHD